MWRFKYSKNTLMLGCMLLVLFTKIQSRLVIPFYDDDIVLLLASVILFCGYFYYSKFKINRSFIELISILFIYVFLFTFIIKNDFLQQQTRSYFLAYVAYIMIVFGCAGILSSRNTEYRLIKASYYLICLFLITCFFAYIDNFNILKILESYLSIERTRSVYGFVQANTTADICLSCLSLGFLLRNLIREKHILVNNKQKMIINVLYFFICFMLISTSSRGGVIAFLALNFSYWYFTVEENFKDRYILKILKPVFL